MNSIYSIGYGHALIPLKIGGSNHAPDFVVYNDADRPARDPVPIIRQALEHPIGTPPLSELAQGKRNAVILVSDKSRLCPTETFLSLLLDELNGAGIADADITVIVALGTHRKLTEPELQELTGRSAYSRVKVLNHSDSENDCIPVGVTKLGTPVAINRHVVQAELRIATGNIEPHGLAGMSGGVKALMPGTASYRTIEVNHALSQTFKTTPGNTDNPVRKDLEEAQQFVTLHFLLNVVVKHDRSLIHAVAGHPIEAHQAGAAVAKQMFIVPAPQSVPYDVVIASPGGYPKDIQLYQSVKTLENAARITKPGGTIIMAARCEEQFGNSVFQQWTETMQSRRLAVELLERQFVLGAHKISHIDQVLQHHNVLLYSDMPEASVERIGLTAVHNLQETIERFTHRPDVRWAIMPYGAITFAYCPAADSLHPG